MRLKVSALGFEALAWGCSFGYSLLAMIIERVSGQTYDQFVRENLIAPNGLTSTSAPMRADDSAIPAPYVDGYVFTDGTMQTVTEDNMSTGIAEGNIISTPVDLARWVRRLIRGEAGLEATSVEAMKVPSPQSGDSKYGLGIFFREGLGYGHNGAHAGYFSLMVHDPAADVSTIVYFNVWDLKNLGTDQNDLMQKIGREARRIAGY